jgi:UDP-N-acetylmuramoyl-tripeptide--D-alanyl-D-alanine ligase
MSSSRKSLANRVVAVRRKLHRLSRSLRSRWNYSLAWVWRPLLMRTRFIAITGSAGKTLTKELIAKILEEHYAVHRTPGNRNNGMGFTSVLLGARPWHDYVIVETPIGSRWGIVGQAKLMKPDIAVMLNVKEFHMHTHGSVEAVAAEKARLLDFVATDGCIVANNDCVYTQAAASARPGRISWFGESASSDVQISNVSSVWPQRLSFTVSYQGVEHQVQTQMVGTHWAGSIAAALTVAVACNVYIADAISAVERVEPNWARMQPVFLPAYDATLIRDERNAAMQTFEAAFQVLADAEATRRIVVVGSYSEKEHTAEERGEWLASKAAACADVAIFVNEVAETGVAAAIRHGMDPSAVAGFNTATEAGVHLQSILQPGDLVLLKGRRREHLSRAYLQLLGEVSCNWNVCGLAIICDQCEWSGFKWRNDLEGLICPPGLTY